MAIQTIYLLGTTAVTPNYWGNTQLNGSAPTAANSAFGWVPGTTALTTPYYRGRAGAAARATAAQAASYNASTSGPAPGTGTTITTAGDSFIAGPFTGTFANTAWTFNWNLRATAVGAAGHINMRVWKSSSANGSSPTQLLANTAGATVTLSNTTADFNSSITWSPGTLTLNNEYLFFQLEWQETTLGTGSTASVAFRIGTAAVTTPNLVLPVTGTLSITQDSQSLPLPSGSSVWSAADAAAASPPTVLSTNRLNFTPTVNSYSSTLRTTISKSSGKLYIEYYANSTGGNMGWGVANAAVNPGISMQVSNPSSAAFYYAGTTASPGFTANYSSTLYPGTGDTVSMAVDFTNGGIWFAINNVWLNSSNPATNTLPMISFDGTVLPFFAAAGPGQTVDTWTLRTFAGNQIYAPPSGFWAWDASSPPGITGTLNLTQANQTLAATGTVPLLPVTGTLNQSQAAQTIASIGRVTVGATLSATQANQTLAATGTVPLLPVTGTLNLTQANQTLAATGGVVTSLNVAYSGNGGVASASSYNTSYNFLPSNANDGFRDPTQSGGWSYGGGWNDDTSGVFPDTFDVTFSTVYSIQEIDIITLRDDFSTPAQPTLTDTFTLYGVTSFVVQYWDGSAFQTLYTTTNNNHVWTQIQFAPVLTNRIHIIINDSADHTWSRLVEVEAWTAVAAPAVTGTLNLTQSSQTIAATGTVSLGAVLNVTQASQILVAAGTVRVSAALSATQANQTLAATGTVRVSGALNVQQANQTIAAAGSVAVRGTLTATQANQTLSATGTVAYQPVTGTLAVTQAAQTLVATGAVVVGGALSVSQAAQTLSAAGSVSVSGALGVTQANQTIAASGGVAVRGTLVVTQANQTLSATGHVPPLVLGTLSIVQDNQTLLASGWVPYLGYFAIPRRAAVATLPIACAPVCAEPISDVVAAGEVLPVITVPTARLVTGEALVRFVLDTDVVARGLKVAPVNRFSFTDVIGRLVDAEEVVRDVETVGVRRRCVTAPTVDTTSTPPFAVEPPHELEPV